MDYMNPSGIGIAQLMRLEQALLTRKIDLRQSEQDAAAAINEARSDHSNREWLDITLKMERIAPALI
jgi:hypothetical protein